MKKKIIDFLLCIVPTKKKKCMTQIYLWDLCCVNAKTLIFHVQGHLERDIIMSFLVVHKRKVLCYDTLIKPPLLSHINKYINNLHVVVVFFFSFSFSYISTIIFYNFFQDHVQQQKKIVYEKSNEKHLRVSVN